MLQKLLRTRQFNDMKSSESPGKHPRNHISVQIKKGGAALDNCGSTLVRCSDHWEVERLRHKRPPGSTGARPFYDGSTNYHEALQGFVMFNMYRGPVHIGQTISCEHVLRRTYRLNDAVTDQYDPIGEPRCQIQIMNNG